MFESAALERAKGRDEGVEAAIECIRDAAGKYPGTPFARAAIILADLLQKVREDHDWPDALLSDPQSPTGESHV